ncbi:C45 family peptidase [Sporosarcina aquimarina]|uniref:C45 family autoproteolytic acyltransferase/hydolase n=1 Tax=Sporosarcina aquimarina TaxID=114975 RepID=UPI00203F3D04|nr:C45 family peptidase [Sporosarcina aquimarina]MCM3758242.1 C45 family peptidase [Sporosarcina aquimarina]
MRKIDILDFKGSYYDVGLAHGRMINQSLHYQSMLSGFKENLSLEQNTKEIKNTLKVFCPNLLDELNGLQEGLKYTESDALKLFGGYDMPILEMGCTSFITSDYYVRNYDFSPLIYDGSFVIQRHKENDWTCGNSELVVGRLDGMNHNGLTCGLHFVNNDLHKKGFIGSTIVRIVLEMCKTVEEALDLLKELPHAASYNYSLADRYGNFAVFEASPEKTNTHREKESLSCVNMFQTDKMQSYNRANVYSSLERMEALSQISKSQKPVREVHNWFSDQASPVFYTDYEHFFGTLHTVSYVPKLNKVLLTAPGDEPNEIIF